MKCKKLIIGYMVLLTVLLFGCNEKVAEKNIDTAEEIKIGYGYYDEDDYQKALKHLLKAYNTGLEDGILVYRIAYSYEQIQGIDDNVKKVYGYALALLREQYPNSHYYTYAKNKVKKFNKTKSNSIFPIAENGDIYNFDNDGDGRREPVYVNGYFRSDGTYVRGHYRARPR